LCVNCHAQFGRTKAKVAEEMKTPEKILRRARLRFFFFFERLEMKISLHSKGDF
jgi:hypothetical protein